MAEFLPPHLEIPGVEVELEIVVIIVVYIGSAEFIVVYNGLGELIVTLWTLKFKLPWVGAVRVEWDIVWVIVVDVQ